MANKQETVQEVQTPLPIGTVIQKRYIVESQLGRGQETVQEVQTPLPIGIAMQERYIVESQLGNGDFGSIYLVRDQHKKQKLFVLAEVLNLNEEESYRFTLEYVALKSLDHQALPRVQYVFNDDKLGRTYVLMSYIEECTLEILRLQQPDKCFPLPKVMTLMVPVLNALNYLHHQNPPVIHGNINPTNIIVSRALKAPVLTMLDLVKESNSASTTLDYFSPGYGAPEQYRKEISTRTDIYALGATCYTLLAGIIPPDALYRSTQLNKGEIDPLKPLDEVISAIPTCITEAIQQSMSLNADDRFSSVQQFEQALIGTLGFQESPTLKLHPSFPEPDLSLKADSVEQKPLEPMTAPTSTTQTNVEKQQSPEPFLVPSVPTVQQEPVSEVPPLLAVTEELPTPEEVPVTLAHEELATSEATPEIEPSASVAQKPHVPEEAALIQGDCEPSTSEIVPSPAVAEEQHVLEVVSSASNQSSIIPDKAVEAPAESLPGQPRTVLSRNLDTVRTAPSRQIVVKTSFVSMFKRLRARKV